MNKKDFKCPHKDFPKVACVACLLAEAMKTRKETAQAIFKEIEKENKPPTGYKFNDDDIRIIFNHKEWEKLKQKWCRE